jgi:uncharacterized protein
MSSVSRLVFDTSTLVGAVLKPRSTPALALTLAWEVADVIVSEETLDELHVVLSRSRVDAFREPAHRVAFFEHYRAMTVLVPDIDPVTACRDPKDDKFLALAVSGGAQALVSSDDNLLSMGSFGVVAILSPRRLLEALAAS